MKQIYAFAICVFLSFFSFISNAQTEGSAFTLTGMGVSTPFARDYQTLRINPANLDIESPYNKSITLGFFQTGVSLYSEILTKTELRQNIFREDIKNFDRAQQLEYATAFAQSKNVIDVDLTSFGFSVQLPKAGSFGFSVNDRVNFYSSLGPQISELMWLGNTAAYFENLILANGDTITNNPTISQDTLDQVIQGITSLQNAQSLSQLTKGTEMRFSWVREFNLGWGKKIVSNDNWEIYGGIGIKFLVGQGMLNIKSDGTQANAFSALSPVFKIDYDTLANNNPSSLDNGAPPLTPVGLGFGFDIGTTIIFKEKFILSASVNDIGSITWDGNIYKLKDLDLTNFSTNGLESVNFVDQIEQLNGGDGLLEWQGSEKVTTKLPTTMRLGFGYENHPHFKVGIDLIAPLNDDISSIEKPVIAVGGEYSPIPWIHLQAGVVQGGNYGTKIPLGIYFTIGEGSWEFGASSRDAFTFFRDNEPTISAAFGFLRFRM